jgi:putative transposase
MPDVHANFFRFEAGQFVEHEGRKFKICALISVDSVLAEDAEDGTSQRLKIETLKPWSPQKLPTQAEASGKKDLSHFTEQEWAQAQKRLEAIKPLLALPVRIRGNVEERARETGVNTATLYEWMKLFQASGHVSALVPERRGRKLGSRYLNQEQETLIQSVIEDKYLHKQRVKVQDVVDEVARRGPGLPNNRSPVRTRYAAGWPRSTRPRR